MASEYHIDGGTIPRRFLLWELNPLVDLELKNISRSEISAKLHKRMLAKRIKMKRKISSVAVAALALVLLSCESITTQKFYGEGMVVSSSQIATETGLNVLKNGGNAVDAAVAVGFALAVVHPEAGNIGGGGFALVYMKDEGHVTSLDFREKAPLVAIPNMYLDSAGNVIPNSTLLGAKAAGVPGTVAGLFELWKAHGSLDWAQVIEPALMLADTGFMVDSRLAASFKEHESNLKLFPETETTFFRNGRPPQAGERLIQKQLATTLSEISADSADGFYTGPVADLIVAAMQKHGGIITHDDLKNYRPVWRDPLHVRFDSLDIYSMALPSSGGMVLAMILKLLEPFDFFAYTPNSPAYIHLFAESSRLAYAERAAHLGDPDFIRNRTGEILGATYLDTRRRLIDTARAAVSSEIGTGLSETSGGSSTTHYCVADRDGNLVSLTYTLNTSYGSKLVVDSAGFLLNNEMDDFAVKAGVANTYGLTGNAANAIAPGKRMLSSMAPTMVFLRERPLMVLGSPGGSRIITTVAQTIINISRLGLSSAEAVAHPRIHHQWLPDTLYMEMNGYDINTKQALIAKGHFIKEIAPFGELNLIYIEPSGLMQGIADPRRGGSAAGY